MTLEQQKQHAIRDENYDEAKRIKMMIDQMRNMAMAPKSGVPQI
jgi:hypothetical protein